MNLLSDLKPKEGSTHYRKVIGRGRGSGMGGTSTKGNKGQKARSGGKIRWGFEGGQIPLARRMPKVGFKNTNFRTRYEIVNLSQLEKLSGEVTPESLVKKGLIASSSRVKVLAHGELKKGLTVKAHKFSAAAKAAIESAGGKIEVLE